MLIIIIIIASIAILIMRNLESATTANEAVANQGTALPIDTTNSPITGIFSTPVDNGLSPIDIGGLNTSIPNAVLSWQTLANKYAQINSILDPEEILAIIWNESSGNPNAYNGADPSWGLMGVTNLIGGAYAGATGMELYDPETNIKAGSAYLAHLKDRFGNDVGWAEAYNEGETAYSQGKHYNPTYATNFNARVLTLKGLG